MTQQHEASDEMAVLRVKNDELQATVATLTQRLEEVTGQLTWFKNQLFGRKSERRIIDVPSSVRQLSLGEQFSRDEVAPPAETETVQSYARRRSSKEEIPGCSPETQLRFDDSVPVIEVELPPEGSEGLSPDQYEVIGEEVTYKLAQQPSSHVVVRVRRPTIKRKDTQTIHTAPLVGVVIDRSFADASFFAGMLVDKFVYHIPFNRQYERLKTNGITVSRATLPTQAIRAIELLTPVYEAQEDSVLSSSVLAMDDTWMKVGVSSPGTMHKGHFWPMYGDKDEVIFPYRESRRDEEVQDILKDRFSGVLIADGHAAYDRYASRRQGEVTRAQCWVHTRRNFFELEGPKELRDAALEKIGRMYELEERIRKKQLINEAKLAFRGEHSRPIVEEFFEWLSRVCLERAFLPSDPFLKAASYALKRKDELRVFLSNPDVPLDTNHNERALRVIPMGRRNYLFCWSELGAQCVGKIQSLLVTARLHGVDPYLYLVDVLQRISNLPMRDVAKLTPRLWKDHFAADPLPSALEIALRQKQAR